MGILFFWLELLWRAAPHLLYANLLSLSKEVRKMIERFKTLDKLDTFPEEVQHEINEYEGMGRELVHVEHIHVYRHTNLIPLSIHTNNLL
jgi:hypothetical protein